MISRLKDQLANDGTSLCCWSSFKDPQLARLLAEQGFGSIVLDAQHAFHNEESLLDCIQQVASVGCSPLVRIPLNRWDLVERVLDFGALGVVAPMINTAEDAERFAEAAKYPPVGARSFGPRYAASLYGTSVAEYLTATTDCTFSLAQIETKEAYDNLDAILAVDGIDGILMGPSDFSIFVTGKTMPDQYGPDTIDLVEDVAKRTRAAGKIAGCFTMTTEHSKLCHKMGYRLIATGIDGHMLQAGVKATLDPLSDL